MSPARRIRELIMCPLERCYPADVIRKEKRLHTPEGLQRIVWKGRAKTREYLASQAI